ncbi:MAG: type I restriction enzyme S subunit [Clostridium sp.]
MQVLSVNIENFETIFGVKNNIQALRNKVLELAIQGKLVEQDLNCESAYVLVKKINEERSKLVKEGRIKKLNPHVPISGDEIPFTIPSSWEWIRFDNIALFKKGPFGSSLTKSMFVPKGKNTYKVYEQKNAIRKDDTLGEYFISEEKFNELKGFEVFPTDIIVSCAGTIGETYVLPSKIERGIINQALMMIDLSCLIEKNFFLMFFETVLNSHITSKSNGSAMKNIPSLEILKNIPFSVPPYKEQIRIVDRYKWFMSEIDKLEESLQKKEHLMELLPKAVVDAIGKCQTGEALKEQLQFVIEHQETVFQTPESMQELRNVVLQLAIEGKLVPQDATDEPSSDLIKRIQVEKDKLLKEGKIKKQRPLPKIEEGEVPFEIPDSWKCIRLGTICKKIGAGSTPTGGKSVYKDNGVKFIRSQNVYNDGLRISNVAFIDDSINTKMKGSQVESKDVLLNITGASIGRCCVVPDNFGYANVNQHVTIIRLVDLAMKEFIQINMISNYIQKLIMDVQVGVSREGLSGIKLSNFIIPLPPINEQHRIVQKVELIMSLIDQMEVEMKRKVDLVEKMANI